MATGITQTSWTDQGLLNSTTYSYRVIATNVLGTSLPSATVSGTRLHPLASLPAWQAEFLSTLPLEQRTNLADPDNDGVANVLEYAHASHPNQPSSRPFQIQPNPSNTVKISFPWNWRATDITWRIRGGTDLANRATWPIVPADVVGTVRNGDVDDISLTFSTGSITSQFFVLEVVSTP
jgi:hypothetical protein